MGFRFAVAWGCVGPRAGWNQSPPLFGIGISPPVTRVRRRPRVRRAEDRGNHGGGGRPAVACEPRDVAGRCWCDGGRDRRLRVHGRRGRGRRTGPGRGARGDHAPRIFRARGGPIRRLGRAGWLGVRLAACRGAPSSGLSPVRVRAGGVSLLVSIAIVALAGGPPAALGARSDQKAIWGPVTVGGKSEFPVYHTLGVGIFEMDLNWADVAPTPPRNPTDPSDPAYLWPADISYAIGQATRYHIESCCRPSEPLRGPMAAEPGTIRQRA